MPDTTPAGEKFAVIYHDVIDYGLSPQAGWLYICLTKHADWETGEAFPSRETLAAYLRLKSFQSADKYVRELKDAGLLLSVRKRWKNPKNPTDVAFEPDEIHTAQTSSLYTLAKRPAAFSQVEGGYATAYGGGTPQHRGGVRQGIHEQDPLNENPRTSDDKHSVGADAQTAQPVDNSIGEELSTAQRRAWEAGEQTRDAHPIHPEWQPNKFHRALAADLGLNLDVEADKFRAGWIGSGEPKTGWGKAFTQYLKDEAEGRTKVTFTGIDEDAADAVVADHVRETYEALNAAETDAPTSPLSEPEFAREERQEPVGTAIDTKIDDGGRHWQYETPAEELVADTEPVATPPVELPAFDDRWRIVDQLRKVKTALPLGFRPGERDQAEAMLSDGSTIEAALTAIKQARAAHQAKRAAIKAELAARRPVPMPVLT